MNLTEHLKRIQSLMFVINEEETITSSNLSTDPKFCNFYRSIHEDTNYINLANGAGDLQDFLITVGHNINKTWKFDIPTARALGTWVWGTNKGYDTPLEIFDKMVSLGYDLGSRTQTPYGPKMAIAVNKMVKKICGELIKDCPISFDKSKPISFYNPKTNSDAKKLKQRCESYIDSNLNKIKTTYINWISSDKTRKKILKQPHGLNKINHLDKLIRSFPRTKISCKGPFEEVQYRDINIRGLANAYFITLNYYSNFVVEGIEDKLYEVMLHEFSHYLDKNVEGINTIEQWDKVLPKIIPNETAYLLDNSPKYSLAGNLLKDLLMGEQIDYKNIKPNTIKDFTKLNIEKQHIQKWIDEWNRSTIEDRIYACNQSEKESNLRSIRNKFKKDDLTYQLTTYDFEKMFKKIVRSDDITWTLTCYAGSRFDPPPSQFINNFNQLANNKNSNTNSFDSPIQYPES